MVTFKVNNMTCNHCVGAITDAVKSIDPGAQLRVDLASHRVHIDPVAVTADVLKDAIEVA